MPGQISLGVAEQILAALAALAIALLVGLVLAWPRDDDNRPRGA